MTNRAYRKRRLLLENLENRVLMAADIHFSYGTLQIDGTDFDDKVEISSEIRTYRYGSGVLSLPHIRASVSDANDNLLIERTFDPHRVNAIRVFAYDGNDIVRNNTDIVSVQYGGDGEDRLYGGSANDVLYGGNQSDRLYGFAGGDTLRGGEGGDYLYGHWGDDTLRGGEGGDYLYGHSGEDDLFGDEGRDFMYGGTNNDVLVGGEGGDYLYGNSGDDELFGQAGNDRMYGGANNDVLVGGEGGDYLYGSGGDDTLRGGGGDDVLYGGNGNDGLYGGIGSDTLAGGVGADRYLVIRSADGAAVDRIQYLSSIDARINFVNGRAGSAGLGSNFGSVNYAAATWSESDVTSVDTAFAALVSRVNNTRLLKKQNGDELTFVRQGQVVNAEDGSANLSLGGWNSGDSVTLVNNAFARDVRRTVFHEIAHNWDDLDENRFVGAFREAGSWICLSIGNIGREHRIVIEPDNLVQATDSNWSDWYYSNTDDEDLPGVQNGLDGFARQYGKMNPLEDFATSFAAYMYATHLQENYSGETPAAVRDRLASRFAVLDDFFASLA
ncbi:MAG: calcium-binding protein [Rubripirellula sp.]|nr:calcium-binding protein [Rubripirellula sp.]